MRLASVCTVLAAVCGVLLGTLGAPIAPTKPHILFIISDDLRPTLGTYGTQALSPHVDALARRGVTFTRAYTQFPWCSPSRQSFMTGRRPDTTKAWTFTTSFRDAIPDAISLPQHFRRQGWWAVSVGKLYHGRNCVRGDPGCCAANATFKQCVQQPQDADWAGGSWDEHPVDFGRVGCRGQEWCGVDVNESKMCDFNVAATAIDRLQAHLARNASQPLFLGVGFRDNHLPWASPSAWHGMFDPTTVKATAHGQTPSFDPVASGGVPKQAWQFPAWVGPEYHLNNTAWLETPELQVALASYMANIAFTDAQLGKVLGAFDAAGYTNDTIVLFTGDHGQNLGEHNTWTKMTAWEHSLRVPLMISVPWLPAGHGQFHSGMAEMVDFYRTLSDLAGIPPSAVDKGVEGDSLAAAVANPTIPGKEYAFSQTQRISVATLRSQGIYPGLPAVADGFYDPSCFSNRSDIQWMGYSVRSAQWRFTEWLQWNGTALCPVAPRLPPAATPTPFHLRRDSQSTDVTGEGLTATSPQCTPLRIPNGTCWHDAPARISNKPGPSASACCASCVETPECTTFVYQPDVRQGSCFLFRAAAPTVPCPNAPKQVAGTYVRPPPPPPPPASEMIELYDHRDDQSHFDLDVAEYTNVATANPEVVTQLRQALQGKIAYCV